MPAYRKMLTLVDPRTAIPCPGDGRDMRYVIHLAAMRGARRLDVHPFVPSSLRPQLCAIDGRLC